MITPDRTAPSRADIPAADPDDVAEPSAEALAAIEAEWPVIAAELDELDCVIAILSAAHAPTEMDIRRYRRAQRQVLRAMRTYLGLAPAPGDTPAEVA